MKKTKQQLQNLLGVLTLALADAQLNAVQQVSGLGTAGCACLVALGQHRGLAIRELAVIAGLSHSVMVRTIENLSQMGLVTKAPGRDKREVLAQLTPKGQEQRQELLRARACILERALASLSGEQEEALHGILASMLTGMTENRDQSDHMCRLCDEGVCGGECPVEQRVLALERS